MRFLAEQRKPIWERLKHTAYFAWQARNQARLPFRPLQKNVLAQTRRLQQMIRHAYRTVPFYRQTMDQLGLRPADFRTVADLHRLPLIEPSQLRNHPLQFFSCAYSPEACVRLFSSGSTGEPRSAYHTMEAVLQNAAHGERERAAFLPAVGLGYGYRETVIGAAVSADHVLQKTVRTHTWVPPSLPIRRQYLSVLDPPEKNLSMINEFKPHIIHSLGSYIAMLFGYLKRGGAAFHKPRVITYSSDTLPETMRTVVEKEFGIPVFSAYEAIEALKIGFECEHHSGLHANIDLYPVRIVNEDGKDVPGGELGEVVISNLVNKATVLLNYRLGDLAGWEEECCPCGRSLPLLKQLAGRQDDSLRLPSGRVLHPLVAKSIFRDVPEVWQYQIVHETPSRFCANVVAAPMADRSALRARLLSRFLQALDEEVRLEVRFVEAIDRTRSGKSRELVPVFASRWLQPHSTQGKAPEVNG
jgi:phenylacetate-CoA ligase